MGIRGARAVSETAPPAAHGVCAGTHAPPHCPPHRTLCRCAARFPARGAARPRFLLPPGLIAAGAGRFPPPDHGPAVWNDGGRCMERRGHRPCDAGRPSGSGRGHSRDTALQCLAQGHTGKNAPLLRGGARDLGHSLSTCAALRARGGARRQRYVCVGWVGGTSVSRDERDVRVRGVRVCVKGGHEWVGGWVGGSRGAYPQWMPAKGCPSLLSGIRAAEPAPWAGGGGQRGQGPAEGLTNTPSAACPSHRRTAP